MSKNTRQQLTLFLDENQSGTIEQIRQKFNPRQYELIKSHITLCREDEIEANLSRVRQNLEQLEFEPFDLYTSAVARFSVGKGVFIPIEDIAQKFQALRTAILKDVIDTPRFHQAHITLMHPRNSTCTDAKFANIQSIPIPARLRITKISLIEQEIGKSWQVLEVYLVNHLTKLKLRRPKPPTAPPSFE